MEKRNKYLDRIEKIKSTLSGDRADVEGLRRKLDRLRVQNEVLQKV